MNYAIIVEKSYPHIIILTFPHLCSEIKSRRVKTLKLLIASNQSLTLLQHIAILTIIN